MTLYFKFSFNILIRNIKNAKSLLILSSIPCKKNFLSYLNCTIFHSKIKSVALKIFKILFKKIMIFCELLRKISAKTFVKTLKILFIFKYFISSNLVKYKLLIMQIY